jgi:hypothetical protein
LLPDILKLPGPLKKIEPDMSEVKMIKKNEGVSWGGLYWQYFEDMDKITGAETIFVFIQICIL